MNQHIDSGELAEKKRALEGYETYAASYDELYSLEQDRKYESVRNYWGFIRSPVLDCGCGTGRLLESSLMRDKVCVGVDYSRNMLRLAKKRLASLGGVALVQADAEHLPFKDQTFSSVISFSLLENLPDWETALIEMSRVARKSSYIIMSSLKKNFQHEAFQKLRQKLGLGLIEFVQSDHLKDNTVVCVNG